MSWNKKYKNTENYDDDDDDELMQFDVDNRVINLPLWTPLPPIIIPETRERDEMRWDMTREQSHWNVCM